MKVSLGGAVTVTSTDRWLSEVRAGRAFVGQISPTAGAGQLPKGQLLNPVGSGITVVVYRVEVIVPAADVWRLHQFNTALTNNLTAKANLLSGGAAPVAEIREENSAGTPAGAIATYRSQADFPVSSGPYWVGELGAGEGLVIARNTVATQIFGIFWWIEV